MPLDILCFKSKSLNDSEIKETNEEDDAINNRRHVKSNGRQSIGSVKDQSSMLKKMISIDAILGRNKPSATNSSPRQRSRFPIYSPSTATTISYGERFSKTNETFSNDDNDTLKSSVFVESDAAEFNEESFKKILVDFNLSKDQIENLLNLPTENKLKIYKSYIRKYDFKNGNNDETLVDAYINSLKKLKEYIDHQQANEVNTIRKVSTKVVIVDQTYDGYLKQLESLKLSLKNRPLTFVNTFLDMKGLESILSLLNSLKSKWRYQDLHLCLIICLKELMNNKNGRQSILNNVDAINTTIQSLYESNVKVKTLVLEMLSAICYLDGGHDIVLNALNHFKKYAHERIRFQSLINFLDQDFHDFEESLKKNLKIGAMSLINALIGKGSCEKNLDYRLSLRYEFIKLGIINILNSLLQNDSDNSILEKHIDHFESKRGEDQSAYLTSLISDEENACIDKSKLDLNDPSFMFDAISKKLKYSTSFNHWSSILHNLLLISANNKADDPNYWKYIDSVVQKVALKLSNGKESDENNSSDDDSSSSMNLNDLIDKIKNFKNEDDSNELNELRKLNASMKSEIERLNMKLKQFESQNNVSTNNIDDESFQNRKKELIKLFDRKTNERKSIENVLRKTLEKHMIKGKVISHNMRQHNESPSSPPPPAPPPPPPPILSIKPINFSKIKASTKPGVPKSSVLMKSLNWNKMELPKNSKESIWAKIDEIPLYNSIDLSELEKEFAQTQGKSPSRLYDSNAEFFSYSNMSMDFNDSISLNNYSTLTRLSRLKREEVTFLEKQRAHIINLTLGSLKLSIQELTETIYSMDKDGKITDQYLYLVPTNEEVKAFKEHQNDLENFSKADRFLYEMSQIFHVEQKLKFITFKNKFDESLKDLNLKLKITNEVCNKICKNENITDLLKLVLCVGNFMNQTNQNGGANRFSILNLNKLMEVKSGNDNSYTLFHFLVNTIENKFPQILNITNELAQLQVITQNKITLESMEVDVSYIERSFADITKEIKDLKNHKTSLNPKDMFIEDATNFNEKNCHLFESFKKDFTAMKNNYFKTINYFGEDQMKIGFDDFFEVWSKFLDNFKKVRADLANRKNVFNETNLYNTIRSRSKTNQANNLTSLPIDSQNVESQSDFETFLTQVVNGNFLNNGARYRKRLPKKK